MIDDNTLNRENTKSSKSLFLFFIDFRNAFGSVEHELIFWTFQQMGIPIGHKLMDIIKSMYTNSSFNLKTKTASSSPIPRTRGVFQGCPLSPTLFLFAIDPILKWINTTPGGYNFIENAKLSKPVSLKALGYADDLLFIRKDPKEIQRMCKILIAIKKHMLFDINAGKSAIMSSIPISPNVYNSFAFFVDDQILDKTTQIPLVKNYKYHGITLHEDLFNNKTRIKAFNRIEETELQLIKQKIQIITNSKLAAVQKLKVIKWISYGRIKYLCPAFAFRNKFLQRIDTLIRKSVRRIFSLPNGSTNDFFYMCIQDGGLGLPKIKESITTQRTKFWCSIMSKEGLSKEIFLISQISEGYYSNLKMNPRMIPDAIKNEDRINPFVMNTTSASKFLIFTTTTTKIDGKIEFARCNNLGKLLTNSYWRISANQCLQQKFKIHLSDLGKRIKITFLPKAIYLESPQPKKELNKFTLSVNKYWIDAHYEDFINHVHTIGLQTRIYDNVNKRKVKRRFQLSAIAKLLSYYSANNSDSFVKFMLKARLGLIGNAVYHYIYNIRSNAKCGRFFCNQDEWPKHIVSSCPKALNQFKKRHDTILDQIIVQIADNCDGEIITDKNTLNGNNLRPDISFAKLKNGNIQIGEVTVCYDTLINQKREFKKQKYETNWIPFFKLQNPTTNPELATFVIGALGTIDSEIIENLQKYDLSKKQAQKLSQKLASYAMHETYNIWISRCKQKWSTRAPLWMRRNN